MSSKKVADKKIIDIARPNASLPSSTSKPIIVTNRPIIWDRTVVDKVAPNDEASTTVTKPSAPLTIQPLGEAEEKPAAVEEAVATEAKTEPAAAETKPDRPTVEVPSEPEKPATTPSPAASPSPAAAPKGRAGDTTKDANSEDKEAAEQAARDVALQRLIESKKYFLPINSVEKRRTKREALAGVLVTCILIAAWLDIALDAGLLHLGGIKPLTHFFSS